MEAMGATVSRPQGGAVGWPVLAGDKGAQVRGHRRAPRQPPMGFRVRALADDHGHAQAPRWGNSHPDPGLASGVTGGVRPRELLVCRRAKAPPYVPLTRSERQLWPHLQDDQPTLLDGALAPETPGILLNLEAPRARPARMTGRAGAKGSFTQRRLRLHIARGGAVRPGDAPPPRAPPSWALVPCGPMLDPPVLAQAHAVQRTDRRWTLEGCPVQMILGFPSDLGEGEETVLGYQDQRHHGNGGRLPEVQGHQRKTVRASVGGSATACACVGGRLCSEDTTPVPTGHGATV
jgi:hypothetical protein